MPLLDDIDWSHSYSVEQDDDLSIGILSAEDLAPQPAPVRSKANPQTKNRPFTESGQQDTIRNIEDTDFTISEDLADGEVAKLDACLKLLAEDEFVFFLPSDELEDDEIHVIETVNIAAKRYTNHELQDYQMQLMLLEQQNKKRLLMARREQDTAVGLAITKNDRRSLWSQTGPYENLHRMRMVGDPRWMGPIQRGYPEPELEKQTPSMRSPILQPIEVEAENENGIENFVPLDESSLLDRNPKTLKRKHVSHEGFPWDEQNKTSNTEPKVESSSSMLLFDTIYKISCSDSHSGSHPVSVFRDVPITEKHKSSRPHFNGKIPIYDLNSFMENGNDGIAFVIIRLLECSGHSVLMAQDSSLVRWTESIYIKSDILKSALQRVATCYYQTPIGESTGPAGPTPGSVWNFDPAPQSLFEQNRITPSDLFLYHHRHLLRSLGLEHSEFQQHVECLVGYTEAQHGAGFTYAENLFAHGLVDQVHIRFLFKPNDILLAGTYGQPAAFILQEWPKVGNDNWITLLCWSFQTDGSGFARKQTTLSIGPLGPKMQDIRSLVAYPLRFATPEVRGSILARGHKHWQLRTPTQITYKGWNVRKDQYYPDARFMIDSSVYRKMHENAKVFHFDKPPVTHPFDHMSPYLNVEQEPSETDLLLMPPDIHGFYLNEKKWIKLFVDSIQPVSWNKKAYERLVLPAQTKDLVRALVTVRMGQKGIKQGIGVAGKRTDITGGKGNGLIMLLHGGPGTGKTLTGESVAEIAEMPLYRVTCGDVGTSAEAVEKYLNTVLHLGKIWNCVLLLDEADIFLEERSMSDLKRNSIVSVFLRVLEYYDGILILTSNRVGLFDEAFKSRIQVALHYENLNRSARKKIWQNFLDMLEEDEEDVNFDEIKFHLDDLAGKELNGRQIRNVLTTARQLAIYRNQRLDWIHLEQALSVSSDFSEYLKRIQGHTDDQRMRDDHLR